MNSRTAIVAAMARELRPLLRGWKLERSTNGVIVYSSENAVAAFAGIGGARAEMAAQAALSLGPLHEMISAGWAAGLDRDRSAGSVWSADTVVDARNNESFEGRRSGVLRESGRSRIVLVTVGHAVSASEKMHLRLRHQAALADMEAASVARMARTAGLPFLAIKAVSDEHDVDLPGTEGFITPDGQFREGAYAAYVALRPALWKPVIRLARNSKAASESLCAALARHLADEENGRKSGARRRI